MTLAWTGDESLFGRIGKIGGALETIRTFLGTTYPDTSANVEAVMAMQDTRRRWAQHLMSEHHRFRLEAVSHQIRAYRRLAQEVVIGMVHDDNPQFSRSAPGDGSGGLGDVPGLPVFGPGGVPISANVTALEAAIREVRKQMVDNSQTIERAVVAAGAPSYYGSNIGNGKLILTTTDGFGREVQNAYAETLRLECTRDGYSGDVPAGNERWELRGGGPNDVDPLHWEWPTGSGALMPFANADAGRDNTGENVLTNGDMEDWSGSPLMAQKWTMVTGTAATDFARSTAEKYRGAASGSFVGGATLTEIKQVFGGSSGTLGRLQARWPYLFHFWGKVDTAPAAGVLTVKLINNDTGATLTDDAGTSQSFTVALTGLTSTWTSLSGSFRIKPTSATVALVLKITTGLSAGRTFYVDDLTLRPAVRAYNGGPFFGLFAGSTNWAEQDLITAAITNDRGGAASNLRHYGTLWARLFPEVFYGKSHVHTGETVILNTAASGAETIADTGIS